jgi:hypothetical protein
VALLTAPEEDVAAKLKNIMTAVRLLSVHAHYPTRSFHVQITEGVHTAKSDDTSAMKKKIPTLIDLLDMYGPVAGAEYSANLHDPKTVRGFKHPATAPLLAPVDIHWNDT